MLGPSSRIPVLVDDLGQRLPGSRRRARRPRRTRRRRSTAAPRPGRGRLGEHRGAGRGRARRSWPGRPGRLGGSGHDDAVHRLVAAVDQRQVAAARGEAAQRAGQGRAELAAGCGTRRPRRSRAARTARQRPCASAARVAWSCGIPVRWSSAGTPTRSARPDSTAVTARSRVERRRGVRVDQQRGQAVRAAGPARTPASGSAGCRRARRRAPAASSSRASSPSCAAAPATRSRCPGPPAPRPRGPVAGRPSGSDAVPGDGDGPPSVRATSTSRPGTDQPPALERRLQRLGTVRCPPSRGGSRRRSPARGGRGARR